jgi:hypothetical protein
MAYPAIKLAILSLDLLEYVDITREIYHQLLSVVPSEASNEAIVRV